MMKKVLYFDCFAGISGDMTLGALLSLGVDDEKMGMAFASLGLPGVELQVEEIEKFGVAGLGVEVLTDEVGHAHRKLGDVRAIINGSGLDRKVKSRVLTIYETIALAEAAVHNVHMEDVVFHEVGALDSIVEVVGAAICLELLGVDEIYCSPLHDGTGFMECAHGALPIPVPAVSEILSGSGISLVQEDIPMELVTPTGAGILRGSGARCGAMPPMKMEGVGWGFGKRETGRLNALRVVLGTLQDEENTDAGGEVWQLEANLKELPENLVEKLTALGALEAWYAPIFFGKDNPGTALFLLCEEGVKNLLEDFLLADTDAASVRGKKVSRKASLK
ncbi:MAG: LarC family nickel insertion protein [Clostridiales bacterium]|nr:LarC family nickel insertion protein [Clostridiales bacterium]